MKRLIFTFLLFVAPLALVFAFPLFVFTVAREFVPVATVIREQREASSELFYGPAFSNYTQTYKAAFARALNANVIVLGSSHVMQFRSNFFLASTTFYNAGGVDNMDDYLDFVRALPDDGTKRLVIVGIDPLLLEKEPYQPVAKEDLLHNFFPNGWREVYKDYLAHKFNFSTLVADAKQRPYVGLLALTTNAGFRSDGSYRDSDAYLAMQRSEGPAAADALASAITNEGNSTYSAPLVSKRVEALKEFLAECKRRNIEVVGFLPPMRPVIYDAIEKLPDARGDRFRALPNDLSQIFGSYGYHLYDMQNIRTYGASVDEFLDIDHASELTMARITAYLANNEQSVKAVANVPLLKKKTR